ncbi:unnamed protein product [Sphagnum troendelagicum]
MGLEQTTTWAVATVCTIFVVASLLVEAGINQLGKWLKKKKMKPLVQTLEKIKDELMVLGFISLLLTVFQPVVASLCMPERLRKSMLPCAYDANANETSTCAVGEVQIISVESLHQIHLFIFVLAIVHVCYSCITVLLGFLKVHAWNKWEQETRQENFDCTREGQSGWFLCDPPASANKNESNNKLLMALSCSQGSLFHQFSKSVTRTDYLTLRVGFLATHKLSKNYDFHKYIQRTMEADFKVVVGIRFYLWVFVVIFLLLDVHGWSIFFWIAFLPLFMVLIMGAKLQKIICELTLEVRGCVKAFDTPVRLFKNTQVECNNAHAHNGQTYRCTPVRLRDDLFWFKRPRVMLYLIHFVLFQNAFELAFFFWLLYTFGFHSCMMGKTWMVLVRLAMGLFVQWLCSYSTLPLYALVTQMGTKLKHSIFEESTVNALHGWHHRAKVKHKQHKHVSANGVTSSDPSIFLGSSSRDDNDDSINGNNSQDLSSETFDSTEASNSEPNTPDGSGTIEISEHPNTSEQQSASLSAQQATSRMSFIGKLLMPGRDQQQEDETERGNNKFDHNAEFRV